MCGVLESNTDSAGVRRTRGKGAFRGDSFPECGPHANSRHARTHPVYGRWVLRSRGRSSSHKALSDTRGPLPSVRGCATGEERASMTPWAPKTHQQRIRERRGGLTPTPRPWMNYSDPRWRAIRQRVLLRDPICKACHTQSSKCADHIVPRSQGGSDELSNLQGVCVSCHNRKSATEQIVGRQQWYGDR